MQPGAAKHRWTSINQNGDTIMPTKSATARYTGLGKTGQGQVSTQSGALADQPYGFGTRFGDEPGTNPEELLAAAHAGCFTMALSFALAGAGYEAGTLDTTAKVTIDKDGDGFTITKSVLTLTASVDGIGQEEFAKLAEGAKAGCPLSKVLKCEVTLEHTLS
jgi:osmotically inducible protein OsmC